MRELGYSCTASADAFRALLSQFRNLDEQAVAGVLGLLAATHKGLEPDGLGLADTMRAILSSTSTSAAASASSSATAWNVNVVMDAIKAAAPSISWPRVAEALDYDGFSVPDAAGFAILMGAWRRATSEPFPLTAIAGRLWTNTAGQLSLLQQAVAAPPDLLSWERSPKKIQPLEGLGQGKSPLGTPNQAWASLDLLAVLAQMADLPAFSSSVLELLRRGPASQCPEVLVATTSLLRGPSDLNWGALERFVWGSVAAPLLFESPAAASRRNVLLQRLWQQRRDHLLQCMANYKLERPDRVPELLEVVLELKGLTYTLDNGPPPLSVELACVAAQRTPPLVDLDTWLTNVLGKDANSGSVMQAALGFLEAQLSGIGEGRLKVPGSTGRPAPGQLFSVLSAESTTAFLRALYTAGACVVPGLANQLVRVLELAKRAFPGAEAALAAAAASPLSGSAADSGLAGGTGGGAFPEAIELEANSYFQKLYHERQPVDELVQQLKAFKAGTAHQQVVFACMVHNLFDEYRFFPNYPDLELDTTAALFGALLHHQLLTNITLGMALRHVLQALAQPAGSKMFRFGLGAIRQIQPELATWPRFCERALAIPHLKAADPALWALMEKSVAAAGPSSSSGADAGDLTSSGGPAAGSTPAAAAAGAGNSNVPNGINSGSAGGAGSNPKGGEQQQQGPQGGRAGAAAAGRGAAAAAGRDNPAPNGPQQQQGGTAAAAGKGGGAGAAGGKVNSLSTNTDTAENLRDMMNNANVAQAAATMALSDKPDTRIGLNMTLNNETLDVAERKRSEALAPNDTLTDKVSFLMNNLTVDNMPVKSKELGNVIIPKYIEWFANYLVVRRAAQEPNHHKTYVFLLETLGHKELSKMVLKTTYYYCRALLESDRAITQTNERTLIKQLGMWLGLLTFSKNKPVLAKDMDLKALIKDAYSRGRMIAVLPFVEKVLAGCKDTKVFKHTNPMIAGILSLMAEIHAMPRLKLNISFVIEMTFKTFEVSLNDVCPSTVLRDLPRVQLHNPDFSALPEAALKGPTGAALHAPLVPPGAPPALTPPPSLAAAAGAGAAAGAAGAAAAPPGTPPQAGAAAAAGTPEAGKGAAASPAAGTGMAGAAAAAGASPAPAAASAEPGLLTKLHMYVQISPQLAPLAERLQLKRLVPVAVDRAMCDIITPVVERSVTIACMTTYELVTKDYATDPDESRLRQAAHLMVSSLAGSLALVTCKEPLRVSLSNQLRSMLQQLDPNTLEPAVQLLVNDNLDLGCTIIERAATDKAVRDIDKSLAAQYEARANARRTGVDFYKHAVLQQQQSGPFPAGLPESLMPKPGNVAQQRVYEDFGRLPRGQPLPARGYGEGGMPPGSPLQAGMDGGAAGAGAAGPALPEAAKAMGPPLPEGQLHMASLIEGLMNWTTQVDAMAGSIAQRDANATWEAVAGEFGPALQQFRDMLGGTDDVTLFCAKRVIKRTWEVQYLNKVHAGLHAEALGMCAVALGGLESLGGRRLQAELTSHWIGLNSEAKFNKDVGDAVIRKGLFLLPEVDAYIAKMLLQTRTQPIGDFALLLARAVRDGLAGYADVSLSLDLLGKLSAAGSNEPVLQLLSAARASSRQRAAVRAGLPDLPGLKDKQDPPGFQQQVAQLFEDFARRAMANPEEKHHAAFVGQLRATGLLNMDEATDRMLRILVELAVNHCLQSEAPVPRADGSQGPGPLSFLAVDPLVKLIVCLVTSHGGGEAFLNRALSITVCLLRRDAEDKAGTFNGRPYLRLLLGLASELAPAEEAAALAAQAAGQDKAQQPRYLRCLGLALLMVQPAAVPGFAYGYLEMISHRVFMPRLLTTPAGAGWPLYEALLVGLLHFLEPALRAAELAEPLRLLYKGTLRLLLVLLHDFPEFLCEHQFRLCEVIPPPAIQMRNLVLSAFPRSMRLPDPFTPNLKVDLLPEIAQPPRGIPAADKLLPRQLRALIDSMLASLAAPAQQQRGAAGQQQPPAAALPAGSMQQVISMLQQQPAGDAAGGAAALQQQARYHLPLLAGLVLYVAAAGQAGAPVQPGSPALELLGRLIAELEPQGRYLLLNAVANQLRYPNAHTHYFSCVLLALFQGASRDQQGEEIRAQITRVLLERLIVNRPHPWGLLITFIELIKNPRYNFWAHNFTRCAPEIERLFESVARSCMGPNAAAVAAAAAAAGKVPEGSEAEVKA